MSTYAAAVPRGTLAPGTKVKVGEYTVQVDRFLSEGGFAHVYLATSELAIPVGSPSATRQHVLKRIAVPDKAGVADVGKEVEVMKLLRNHPRIVNFIEASFSEVPATTGTSKSYEIYILMEWCAGGGIIDMMNTRLQNRMTESEILKIFSDVVEAVAHMHYQSPPLIHRDLKVENILLSPPNNYKLCDFGSTTTPLLRIPTAVAEIQAMEADINKTTTLQYRAPELMDVWSRKGYDEKIDIWALGVFLYKLCYYTTPFEEAGPLAIINAQYKIPSYPVYSGDIKHMIGVLLQERASQRPNIYQVHERLCKMRGTTIKLENKYANRTTQSRPDSASSSKPSSNYSGIITTGSQASATSLPDLNANISPMRRGRPSRPNAVVPAAASTSTGERFRAFDAGNSASPSAWDAKPSLSNGNTGFGDSFVGAKNGSNGFGDSFSPALSRSPLPPPPSSAPPYISQPASSSALFSDLVPPSSSSSTGRNSVSPAPLPPSSFSATLNSFHSTSTSSTAPPIKIAAAQLTGEAVPPLPRRPIVTNTTQRPELISKSSQTSPSLMSTWKPPSSPLPPSLPPKLAVTIPKPLDLLGDDPLPSAPLPLKSASSNRTKRLSFVGGPSDFTIASSTGPFRPSTPKTAPRTGTTFASTSKPIMARLDAAVRYPALEPENEVVVPVVVSREAEAWVPIVEKEEVDESSDDDDFAPRSRIRLPSTPPSPNIPSVSQSNATLMDAEVDEPAPPPIIQRIDSPIPIPVVQPTPLPSQPILQEPKPQSVNRQVAIENLVSRYETLSTSPTIKSRPPPPTKPAKLRKSSIAASTDDTGNSSASSSRIIEEPTFERPVSITPVPSLVAPSTPNRFVSPLPNRMTGERLPFKPVAPPSPALSRPPPQSSGPEEEVEQETPFAGVSSLVSRWQGMAAGGANGEAPKRRKDFAVI